MSIFIQFQEMLMRKPNPVNPNPTVGKQRKHKLQNESVKQSVWNSKSWLSVSWQITQISSVSSAVNMSDSRSSQTGHLYLDWNQSTTTTPYTWTLKLDLVMILTLSCIFYYELRQILGWKLIYMQSYLDQNFDNPKMLLLKSCILGLA